MKVHELQHFLGSIVPFARAAGASNTAVTELDRALQCLEPFKERTLADFNDFLRRADEFDRTGKLTPPAKNGKARAAKAGSLSVDDAAGIYRDLLGRAADPKLTYGDIDAALKPIEKMTAPQLLEVAAKVDVPVPTKPKAKIMEGLKRRITELKASSERTQYRFGA
jgi:hypothetical protein